MNAIQAPVSPRTGWLSELIILNERIRRDRIIVLDLDPSDWIDITLPVEMPAHVADAALKKDRV